MELILPGHHPALQCGAHSTWASSRNYSVELIPPGHHPALQCGAHSTWASSSTTVWSSLHLGIIQHYSVAPGHHPALQCGAHSTWASSSTAVWSSFHLGIIQHYSVLHQLSWWSEDPTFQKFKGHLTMVTYLEEQQLVSGDYLNNTLKLGQLWFLIIFTTQYITPTYMKLSYRGVQHKHTGQAEHATGWRHSQTTWP